MINKIKTSRKPLYATWFLAALLPLWLSGCITDHPIGKQGEERKLTLSSIPDEGEKMDVMLGVSQLPDDPYNDPKYYWAKGGKIQLFVNGAMHKEYISEGGIDSLDYIPQFGDKIKLIGQWKDYPMVIGETEIPKPPLLKDFSVIHRPDSVVKQNINIPTIGGRYKRENVTIYYKRILFKITVQDYANEPNFYRLRLRFIHGKPYETEDGEQVTSYSFRMVELEDPVFELPVSGMPLFTGTSHYQLFSDRSFANKEHTFLTEDVFAYKVETEDGTPIEMRTSPFFDLYYNLLDEKQTFQYEMYLHHQTPDLFHYMQTFLSAQNSKDNPFAEPAQVYSNIKNGFGIVAGHSKVHKVYNLKHEK